MLLRSASTPILKYPAGSDAGSANNFFLNRPKSLIPSPIRKLERTMSDSSLLKLFTVHKRKNFCTNPVGSPVSVKEEGMGVFAAAGKEQGAAGGGSVGGGRFSCGGDGCEDWGNGKDKLEEYYQMMIKTFPGDALLLTNYAKYLKEVRGEFEKAEEYCARAMMTNANGDVLSLYAELIWRNHKDAARAETYFKQATKASPNDCHVHAAYARFLWDAGVEEEEEEVEEEEEEEKEKNHDFQFPELAPFPPAYFSHEHPITAAY